MHAHTYMNTHCVCVVCVCVFRLQVAYVEKIILFKKIKVFLISHFTLSTFVQLKPIMLTCMHVHELQLQLATYLYLQLYIKFRTHIQLVIQLPYITFLQIATPVQDTCDHSTSDDSYQQSLHNSNGSMMPSDSLSCSKLNVGIIAYFNNEAFEPCQQQNNLKNNPSNDLPLQSVASYFSSQLHRMVVVIIYSYIATQNASKFVSITSQLYMHASYVLFTFITENSY